MFGHELLRFLDCKQAELLALSCEGIRSPRIKAVLCIIKLEHVRQCSDYGNICSYRTDKPAFCFHPAEGETIISISFALKLKLNWGPDSIFVGNCIMVCCSVSVFLIERNQKSRNEIEFVNALSFTCNFDGHFRVPFVKLREKVADPNGGFLASLYQTVIQKKTSSAGRFQRSRPTNRPLPVIPSFIPTSHAVHSDAIPVPSRLGSAVTPHPVRS
jgi:hypothetical protein